MFLLSKPCQVAEATARKKAKQAKRMESIKKQAMQIADASDMNERGKTQAIEKLMKKARKSKRPSFPSECHNLQPPTRKDKISHIPSPNRVEGTLRQARKGEARKRAPARKLWTVVSRLTSVA